MLRIITSYNFNAHQPILVIFGRDVAERKSCRMVICCPTSASYCLCTTWGKHEPVKFCLFSHAWYSPRPPTLSDRNQSLFVGWSSGGNSEVLISSKSVKRFRSCGGRGHNLPFPIDFTKSVGKRPNRLRKFRQLASSVHNVARAGCESSGLNKSSSNWVKSDKICNRAFELYAIFLLPHFLQSTS